jgi:DNA-binding response OmpR family regulator
MDSPSRLPLLVLDPDPSIRTLLTAVLQRNGFAVTACGIGDEAAAHCRHGRYAAVILSTDMPRYDGLLTELYTPLSPPRPKIIVAATSETARPISQADAVLMKPFHLAELYDTIAGCFSESEAMQGARS